MKYKIHPRCITSLLLLMAFFLHADNSIMRHYFSRTAGDASLPYRERLDACDSLVRMARNPAERRSMLMRKGRLLYNLGLLHQADGIYESLMKEGEFSSVSEQCAVLVGIVKIGIFQSNYHKSLEGAKRLEDLRKPDSLRYYDAEALYAKGAVLGRLDQMDSSEEMVRKALDAVEKDKNSFPPGKAAELKAKIYILQSSNFIRLKKYNEAFAMLDRAEAAARTPGINLLVNLNRAVVYQIMGKNDIAARYYERLLGKEKLIHYNTGLAASNYLTMMVKEGRGKEAMELYNRNRDVLDLLQGTEGEARLHRNMVDLYASLGDYRKAYDEHLNFVRVADSIGNANLRLQFETGNPKAFMSENHDSDDIWQKVAIIAIGVLFAGALLLFIIRVRRRHTASADIMPDYPTGTLNQQDIQALNHELTSMALQLASATEALKTIRDDIGDEDTDATEKLELLRRDLLGVKLQRDAWESFDKYFAHMYPGYVAALCKAHPLLTAGELRMCAFIALNLSTKDIAALTNRSTRTVEATKYRLNKKLNPQESLVTYLHRFL